MKSGNITNVIPREVMTEEAILRYSLGVGEGKEE